MELQEQSLQAAEILVVAERPPVELDLTASKQTMTASDLDELREKVKRYGAEVRAQVGGWID